MLWFSHGYIFTTASHEWCRLRQDLHYFRLSHCNRQTQPIALSFSLCCKIFDLLVTDRIGLTVKLHMNVAAFVFLGSLLLPPFSSVQYDFRCPWCLGGSVKHVTQLHLVSCSTFSISRLVLLLSLLSDNAAGFFRASALLYLEYCPILTSEIFGFAIFLDRSEHTIIEF